MDNSIGIYIHIPFCKSKCYYCDFNSYSGREHLAGSYFDALLKEIEYRAASLTGRPVKSIFIGGGTPSLVEPGYINDLLEACSRYFKVEPGAEISMESNPGTLTFKGLKAYRAAGVNRLSMGLQAWQDGLLEGMGRIHRRQQFIDNFEAACKAGFHNINADLIFGLPGQSFDDWAETLEAVTALGADNALKHLSCYDLKIEEGTVFGDRFEKGLLRPVDDELDRSMYRYTVSMLAEKGFRHYEISNFAKSGFECRHNLVYWKALEYAGFGAGAHSYVNGWRFGNIEEIEAYINAVRSCPEKRSGSVEEAVENYPAATVSSDAMGARLINREDARFINREQAQFINRQEAMAEFMILGLRLTDGVSDKEFHSRFGEKLQDVYGKQLGKLIDEGLLKKIGSMGSPELRFFLTELGLDLANRAFEEFI